MRLFPAPPPAWLATLACLLAAPALAQSQQYTAAQLFEVANKALAANQIPTAEAIFRALEQDPSLDIRSEARFRHGQLLESQKRYPEAAALFRALLAEQPKAQRVRLELAQVLAQMGHGSAARRELRLARSGSLPPQVAQMVNQFAAALRSTSPYGGSLELGVAPTDNINRATGSTTLNSIFGPLDLSADARARAGVAWNVGGQAFVHDTLSPHLQLLAQVSTQNQLTVNPQFDDDVFAGDLGANLALGRARLRITGGVSYRLYGTHPYTLSANASVNWSRPLTPRTQIELQSDFSAVTYRTNALQNGDVFSETLSLSHGFGPRLGGKLSLFGQRVTAADPGYATLMEGATVLVWRDFGRATVYGSASVSHLASDARLFIYPDLRQEWLTRASLGATFTRLKLAGFSPVVRLNYERNQSTVSLYAYHRLSGEIAINRSF